MASVEETFHWPAPRTLATGIWWWPVLSEVSWFWFETGCLAPHPFPSVLGLVCVHHQKMQHYFLLLCACFTCDNLCVWERRKNKRDNPHTLIFFVIWQTFPSPPSPSSSLVPQPAAFTQPFSTLVNAALLFCFSIHRHAHTHAHKFHRPLSTLETPDEPLGFSQKNPSSLWLSPNLVLAYTNTYR